MVQYRRCGISVYIQGSKRGSCLVDLRHNKWVVSELIAGHACDVTRLEPCREKRADYMHLCVEYLSHTNSIGYTWNQTENLHVIDRHNKILIIFEKR